MKRLGAIFAILVCTVVISASVLVGPAAASDTDTYTFYNCHGPSPSTFVAVKTALPQASPYPVSAASAFRLIDGSAIFVVRGFSQGAFSSPGKSANATVTCAITFTSPSGTFYASGFLAPPQ